MSEQCRDFITMALEKKPLERPTVMEMLHHPWMKVGATMCWHKQDLVAGCCSW